MKPSGKTAAPSSTCKTIDDIFVESYASLFADGLAAAQNGETLLYRVTDAGYAPVEMEVTAR